jgi:hypothetical protein
MDTPRRIWKSPMERELCVGGEQELQKVSKDIREGWQRGSSGRVAV